MLDKSKVESTEVRCKHKHLLAVIAPDGTVVVKGHDGCTCRVGPLKLRVVLEKKLN